MVWSRLTRRRREAATPVQSAPACRPGHHVLRTERLLLFTPENGLDLVAVLAAASDHEAQRWLGWDEGAIVDAKVREKLVHLRPGHLGSLRTSPLAQDLLARSAADENIKGAWLVGVRADDGRYAGCTQVDPETGELGGWLAPHARGARLGTELFRAAVHLGHAHLGIPVLRAGHEPANTASGRALAGAGFVPDEGPDRHTLPNGREIEARWLRHTAGVPPTCCPGAPVPAPPGAGAR